MKLKYLVTASALALASAGAQAATTLSYGGEVLTLLSSPETIGTIPSGETFSHDWTLNVAGENQFFITFEDIDTEGTSWLDITALDANGHSAINFNSSPDSDTWISDGAFVANGVYTITVSGQSTGDIGGLYGADIAPVPVPPAALLFGSALLGLAALKRKKAASDRGEA